MTTAQRWIVGALALLGAQALVASSLVLAWWRVGELSISPFATWSCWGECREGAWLRSSVATGAAGMVATVALVAIAGAAAAGRAPRLLVRATFVALATAIACATYYVASFPGVGGASVHVELGMPAFAVGCALGAAAAVVATRAR